MIKTIPNKQNELVKLVQIGPKIEFVVSELVVRSDEQAISHVIFFLVKYLFSETFWLTSLQDDFLRLFSSRGKKFSDCAALMCSL